MPAACHSWEKKELRKAENVYAVLRLDFPTGERPDGLINVTVKEIVWTVEDAQKEVDRLNQLNAEKSCRYFWQTTRLKEDPMRGAAASAG